MSSKYSKELCLSQLDEEALSYYSWSKNDDLKDTLALIRQGDTKAIMEKEYPADIERLLLKQHFIELLRNGKSTEALAFLRERLNPEKYGTDLNEELLLLLYSNPSNGVNAGGANSEYERLKAELFSDDRRHLLANLIFNLLAGQNICLLDMQLKYLSLLNNMFHALKGSISPFESLLQRLVVPSPVSRQMNACDDSKSENQVKDEDVLHLSQLVGFSIAESRQSIRQHGGLFHDALKDALKGYKCVLLDYTYATELCEEYLIYRGLLKPASDKRNSQITGLEILADLREGLKKLNNVPDAQTGLNVINIVSKQLLDIYPSFKSENAALYFRFKKVNIKVLKLLAKTEDALKILRTDLSEFEVGTFENEVKDLSYSLICDDGLGSNKEKYLIKIIGELRELSGLLFSTVAKHLGIEEPGLLKIYKYLLLEVHERWFEQQGEEDYFVSVIELDKLLSVSELPSSESRKNSSFSSTFGFPNYSSSSLGPATNKQNQNNIPTTTHIFDAINEDEILDDNDISEEDISTVMDVMGCSRVEAVSLLGQHGGRIGDALNSIFG
ncbi:hypothetical protein MP638_005563 [Amoeboaphelidium occidentale]|nr:hypothetical protein MP638_005563 [Amoeboaphelidium occidentale]